MNRRIFICTICIFISFFCNSQSYQHSYYLDYNLGSTEKAKAVILGKGLKEDSLFRLDCFAMTGEKPYMSFHFKDSSLSDLKGPFVSYHSNGRIENQGNYWNAYEEGVWQKWDSEGRKVDSIVYRKGIKMISSNYRYGKNNLLSFYTFKDSLNDLYENIDYDENGKIGFEAFFIGTRGILKTHNKDGSISLDSVFSRDHMEAEFSGGAQGWMQHLKNNMNVDVPVNNKAPEGIYEVIIKFTVRKNGSIADIFAETNQGYGMEEEAIRVIRGGRHWVPASLYGRKVDAYRRQPITFVVSKR